MTDASDSGSTSVDRWQPLFEWSQAFWKQIKPFGRWLLKLWKRVIRALQEMAPVATAASPAAALAGPLSEQLDTPVPIRVSGQGRRFNFHIHASCVWSSTGLRRDELRRYAYQYTPDVIRRLTQVAAAHAVNFGPHRIAELEAELQQALSRKGPWPYPPGRTVVSCQPHVWVELDERVWRLAQPYWDKLVTLTCEHDLADFTARLKQQRGPDNGASARRSSRTSGDDPADEAWQVVADLRAAAQRLEDLIRRTRPDDGRT